MTQYYEVVPVDKELPGEGGIYYVKTKYSDELTHRMFDGKVFHNYNGFPVTHWLRPLPEGSVVVSGWIDVFIDLPKENQEVFICHVNSAGKHICEALFKKNNFYYTAETDKGYYEEIFGIVTKWMPLPETP